MKPCLLPRFFAVLIALAMLGGSVACVYPERGYWHHPGWHGPEFYHRS